MNPVDELPAVLTRRQLLGQAGLGLGAAALGMLRGEALAETVRRVAPRANRVIYLFQNGGPTHVDLFDYKPKLTELAGQPVPTSLIDGKRFSTMTAGSNKNFLPEITHFAQRGECGRWIAEDFLPHTAGIVDDLCFVRSMQTTQVNHAPAITYFLTGIGRATKTVLRSKNTANLDPQAEERIHQVRIAYH